MYPIEELDNCTNMFGKKINADTRARIMNFLDKPNTDTWDEIQSIIISWSTGRVSTIWQFVLEVDPSFCWRGRAYNLKGDVIEDWERIPNVDVVRKALIYATH